MSEEQDSVPASVSNADLHPRKRRSRGEGAFFWSESKKVWVARITIGGKRRHATGQTRGECLRRFERLMGVETEGGGPATLGDVKRLVTEAVREAVQELVAARRQPRLAAGYVYLVELAGSYKIGMSGAPHKRAKEVCSPAGRMIHFFPSADAEAVEAELHARFRGRRIGGEWFSLTPADVVAICRVGRAAAVEDLPDELRRDRPEKAEERQSRPASVCTLDEVAELLCVPRKLVCRLIDGGQLDATKSGGRVFVTSAAIDRLVEANRVPAKPTPELPPPPGADSGIA
jgi:excisionase family DNA binding protein